VSGRFAGRGGNFYAEVGANGSSISISRTDDPGGQCQWNGLVLTRAAR